MSILEELKWRGLVADCTDAAELAKRIASPITLYCGFDPTADSLHVGNLVPLLALRRFQLLGHHPIAVAGGATGMVGDPSGKTSERQLLTPEVLAHNISRVKEQLKKLLDFETKTNPARLVDNASWTKDVSYLDFLRDIGKHFSVNQMVAKESVRARMDDREVGISYTEFSYMLLQAFDFMVLCRDANCELQIGGSDQWGNITAGIELARKKLGKPVYGLTLPLITNADGTKFGKTEAGAIWLDANRTSVEDFRDFWINTDDRDVIRYLKYFTFLTQDEIKLLEKQHVENPGGRVAHKTLANAVTDLIHGRKERERVERGSEALFGSIRKSIHGSANFINPQPQKELLENISPESTKAELKAEIDFENSLSGMTQVPIEQGKLEVGLALMELLVFAGLSSSKSQARRDIEGGGVYINEVRVPSVTRIVTSTDFLFGKPHILLRKGKKNYVVVTAKQCHSSSP